MLECYNYVFGFSQDDCECSTEGRPEDYDISGSGLFLDDLAPISTLLQANPCSGTVWDMMQKARTAGIKQLVADSNALLGKRFRLKRKPLGNTVLGTIKAKALADVTKNYTVTVMACSPIRSGYVTLDSIGTVFSATGQATLEIYDNEVGLLKTIPLNTTANKHTPNKVNLELPMYSKYVGAKEYYFVVTTDIANLPKDTFITCGCGGWEPEYNKLTPYYYSIGARKSAAWSDYVMIGGTQINSISELDELPNKLPNNMYGLALDIKAGCNISEVLCKDSLDFAGNPLALSLAFAARYITAVQLGKKVLKSTVLTRENMINTDLWEESIDEWNDKYNEHINYIVAEADHTGTDCLECKDLIKMTQRGLFS